MNNEVDSEYNDINKEAQEKVIKEIPNKALKEMYPAQPEQRNQTGQVAQRAREN